MSMDLNENVVGVWFIQLTLEQDFLLTLYDLKDGKFEIIYRFRYYADAEAWDSKDEKHWYRMIVPDTRDNIIELIRIMTSSLALKAGSIEMHEVINNGDFDNFMERFMHAPFVHTREATPEEIEDMKKRVN